jgi:hypothetical protein
MKFCTDVTPLQNIPVLYVQSPAYSNIIMADARNLWGWERIFFHAFSMEEPVK